MQRNELVHHIDGDKQNNNPNNLVICKNTQEHRRVHDDLEKLAMILVANGVIQFDRKTNRYRMPHLKEILDAYRVNSGETYVLDLENMAILSQANLRSEGATTIPLGSRDQVISKRTTTYLEKEG